MTHATVSFEIQSYWHAGTGEGGGPGVDARVAVSPDGLPYLSGRAVRGLLREALRTAARAGQAGVTVDKIERWFGTDIPRERSAGPEQDSPDEAVIQEQARFSTHASLVSVTNAVLGRSEEERRGWSAWAAGHRSEVALLRSTLSSTALDEHGVANDRSLREIEVAVPMTLHAGVQAPEEVLDTLKEVAPLIREFGANRTRGFGRVRVEIRRGGDQ